MGGVTWEGDRKAGQMASVTPEGNQTCRATLEIDLEAVEVVATALKADQTPGQVSGAALEVDVGGGITQRKLDHWRHRKLGHRGCCRLRRHDCRRIGR